MSVQDLRLVGVADDGVHLLLADPSGARYRLPIDTELRSAARHEHRPAHPVVVESSATMTPREVQTLIRAGASAEEVAEMSGWSPDKISRYEGPIIAEREHVAGLATSVRLRGGGDRSLLSARVGERLQERGVDPATASWDAWRVVGSPWTLALTFPAGGRLREARWHFDLGARSVDPVDDEARWLSGEDEPATPEPLVPLGSRNRVYDVESEGGIHSPEPSPATRPGVQATQPATIEQIVEEAAPPVRRPQQDDDGELMASMREHSTAARRRGRKTPARTRRGGKTATRALSPADPQAPSADDETVVASPLEAAAQDAPALQTPPLEEPVEGAPAAVLPEERPDAEEDAPSASGPTPEQSTDDPTAGDEQQGDDEAEEPEEVEEPAVQTERSEPKVVPVRPGRGARPARTDDTPDPDAVSLADRTDGTGSQASGADEPAAEDGPGRSSGQRRQPSRRKAGRPSVPSWDDIMFGAKKDD